MDLLMRRQATRAQRTQQTQPAVATAATEYPETAYRAAASAAQNENHDALWGRGFCPAAGLPPGVACNNDVPGETTPSPLHQ